MVGKHVTHWLLAFCIVLKISGLYAQSTDFLFESLPASGNVGQTTVTTLLQDRRGFLWFGTWSGLARYDGYTMRLFGQESGLSSTKITCLLEESDGTLWVGTRNAGLFRYDPATERFGPAAQALGAQNELSKQNISSVFRDREGRFWIGAEEGLAYFDPATRRFVDVPLRSITPPPSVNLYLYAICQTADGSLWVGGSHGLFHALPTPAGQTTPEFFQVALHSPGDRSPRSIEYHNFVYTVVASRRQPNTIWLGNKKGLNLLSFTPGAAAQNVQIQHFGHNASDPQSLSHDFATAVCEGDFPQKNAVWVATFNGLNLLDPDTGKFRRFYTSTNPASGLNANNVRSLFFDRTGILWVGTEQGVNKLDPRSANFTLQALRREGNRGSDAVSYLSQTSNALWVGTFGGGIYRAPLHNGRPDFGATRHYTISRDFQSPVTDFISAVFPDGLGNIWVVTQGAGAFRIREADFPPGGGTIRRAEQFGKGAGPLNTSDDYLMSALVSGEGGRVWLGCWDGGLSCYDPARQRVLRFSVSTDGLADFHQYPVVGLFETVEDGQRYLWAGTRGGGVFQLVFDPAGEGSLRLVQRFHQHAPGQQWLGSDFITSVAGDAAGNFWITSENGVFIKRPGDPRIVPLFAKNPLQNPIAQAITADSEGRMWVSTQGGIACLLPAGQEPQVVFYNRRNGLRDHFFNSSAVCRLATGEILFGGNNGITGFDPARIRPDTAAPLVAVTGLRLFNRPVQAGVPTAEGFLLENAPSELPLLCLSHRDNVVSFEFTGMHFSCPEQNLYTYKLEGFDDNWVTTDAGQRLAHYTNLPPGEYTFLVKAANSDGVWNPVPARLAIRVLPPWWRSNWAYTLYLAAFVGALYGVRRITLLRVNFENKIKLERLEKQKLEEVNQMKLVFFTNISHELKTPLTLILSPLEELIRDRAAGDPRLHGTFTRMHRNAVRLLTMINQLLDIRKAEAGLMKMEVAPGNVVQLVGEICLSFRELAQQHRIGFSFHVERPQIQAWFDADQLEKVFFNLLSNAFKFTPDGGVIRVEMGEDPATNHYYVTVSDTGKGIPHDKLPRIFERFYQADDHHEPGAQGGTGIGLSLVQTIVESHHGTVAVESEPGKGSVFTVRLPLGEAHFSTEEKKQHAAAPETPVLNSALTQLAAPLPDVSSPELETPVHEGRPTLLVVEDNPDIRAYLRDCLRDEYEVVEAADGAAGLDQALEHSPDLVLCDISMPGMDGLELTRTLKTRVETSHIPVVLLTARSSLIFKIDGLETGADDYVTKPFNVQLLRARVRNLIESRRRLREKYARTVLRAFVEPSEVELPALDEAFLQSVTEAVEHNLENPDFSVDDLARQLLLNRKQVYRKIKALTDQGPKEYIRIIRLKRAAQLLKTHRYTVAEVTYKVGFQDLKNFRERFREFYGVSPSEFE